MIEGSYYAESGTSLTLSETGKTIESATGVSGTANSDGTYSFTVGTADINITALVYAVADFTGDGTEDSPYQIASATDLAKLAEKVNDGTDYSGKYFKVTANIDLSEYENWTPIGTISNKFQGNFDGGNGDGYKISGLKISNSSENYQGLFSFVGSDSTIANVTLDSPSVEGEDQVGALAGENRGTISNCTVTGGTVTGNDSVGALIGNNYEGSTISGCTVTGEGSVGGLIGYSLSGRTVSGNTVTGATVEGSNNVGGLIGENSGTASSNTSVTQSVSSTNYVGGFIGENSGTASNNTSVTQSVSSTNYVGGFIGENSGTASSNTSVAPSVSASGTGAYVGGFIGRKYSGTVSADNYFYSSTTDSSSATKMYKVTASGVTITSTPVFTDSNSVNYYSGTITFTAPEVKTGYSWGQTAPLKPTGFTASRSAQTQRSAARSRSTRLITTSLPATPAG